MSFDENGTPTARPIVKNGNQATISDGDADLSLSPTNGEVLESGAILIRAAGDIAVSGRGFEPGSTVEVWVFSTPVLLGTTTVQADGSFAATLSMPSELASGDHTIQAEGLIASGVTRALALGITFDTRPTELPVTGNDSDLLANWALALFVAGVLVGELSRRRRLLR